MDTMKDEVNEFDCSSPKPKINERPFISDIQARELESLFKIIGNQTRLKILHALIRAGELCVSDIARELKMKQQAISNQLQRLGNQGILTSFRRGNNIHYRIIDPCVVSLLDKGLCLLEDSRKRIDSENKKKQRKNYE